MLFEIFDPKAAPKPIGIDLGTTNSLVACVRNEKPETIANCDGERLLPSVVSYAEGEPVDQECHTLARSISMATAGWKGSGFRNTSVRGCQSECCQSNQEQKLRQLGEIQIERIFSL